MPASPPASDDSQHKERPMQDLLWILVMLGLVAATLAYVRLCDNA